MKDDTMPQKKFSRDEVKAHILYKLARRNCWGGKHTELIFVRRGLPREYQGEAEEIARELADAHIITWLKKTNQIHISLNPHVKKEILELIERYLGKQIW